MSDEIKKVYTDNPYVDELVYYTKKLGIGTVLKLKDTADKNETLETLKQAGIYISCLDGNAILKAFDYFPYEVLTSTKDSDGRSYGAGLPDSIARDIVNNPDKLYKLSKESQQNVLNCMKIYYPEHYEEKNGYYRMLNGLPPIGYPDIYLSVTDLPAVLADAIDITVPLHLIPKGEVILLDSYGVLDTVYEKDIANRGFVKHLGKKRVSIYLARKASNFDPVYIPSIDSDSSSIKNMYIERLTNNITYTMRTVYSEAYKYGSDYYDNIIAIFIVLITMIDIISRVQEFITRKEIFDIRSVQYLFDSYGVDFFEDIPLRYQVSMVKNIHQLLKFKSTAQCMIDICSLFGFDNINVFKYYLLKDRNIDITTGDYVFDPDPDKEYTLKFVKLPLQDDVDDYIRTPSNHIDYDIITEEDGTWDGGLNHNEIKREILKQEFNIVRTKYISIDTVYDIAKMSMQQSYFFNMLYDNVEAEVDLKIKIPYIDGSHEFELSDAFSMLTALSYYYYNKKDTFMDTQGKVLYVNGFNFKADLAVLASEIKKTSYGQDALKILKNFKIAEGQIPSFEQMMTMFINNLEVRDQLINGMRTADNMRVYEIYKKLYDSLMTVELTLSHFKDPVTKDFYRDTAGDATYTEYFQHVEPLMYYQLMEAKSIEEDTERQQYIGTLIDNIVQTIEKYVDLTEFQALLQGLPSVSSEAVKQYIAMVINFYKSYKVDFLGLNTIYYLDDKIDGLIEVIDDMELERYFEKTEIIKLYETFKAMNVTTSPTERIKLLETAYFDINTFHQIRKDERINVRDDIPTKIAKFIKYTAIQIAESIGIHVYKTHLEFIDMHDLASVVTKLDKDDNLNVYDRMWLEPFFTV